MVEKKMNIYCPICDSPNFLKGEPGQSTCMLCEDCGEQFSIFGSKIPFPVSPLETCVICGCGDFYNSPLPRLVKRFPFFIAPYCPVCYCCETRYDGFECASILEHYDQLKSKELANAECRQPWRKYVRSIFKDLKSKGYEISGGIAKERKWE